MDAITPWLGHIAALGTALCWVFTSLSFAAAGRRIGSATVNLLRLFVALSILWIVYRIVFNDWFPDVDRVGLIYLALSGLIGLTIGDQFLFTAFVDIGPRLSTLLMTFWSPVAALLAWPMLNEPLNIWAIVGIAITLSGVIWVVMERPATKGPSGASSALDRPHFVRGVLFGLGGAACQAVGFILAKIGIGHTRLDPSQHMDPWPATLTRMAFAAAGMTLLYIFWRIVRSRRAIDTAMEISPELEHLEQSRPKPKSIWPFAMLMVFTGAVCGPVVGVWLSLVALDRTSAGIAATLMTMTPVFILPFAVWLERERISWRAGIGAAIAVIGVSTLSAFGRATPPVTGDSASENLPEAREVLLDPAVSSD